MKRILEIGGRVLVAATVAAGLAAGTSGEIPMPAGVTLAAQAPQPAQEEFVPIDELPPEEQLPAAPLLVGAYAFVWVALLAYLWSIWNRLKTVERELTDVGRRASGAERRG